MNYFFCTVQSVTLMLKNSCSIVNTCYLRLECAKKLHSIQSHNRTAETSCKRKIVNKKANSPILIFPGKGIEMYFFNYRLLSIQYIYICERLKG